MSKKKPEKRNPMAVEVRSSESDNQLSKEKVLAQTYLRPTVMAAATIKGAYLKEDDVNINALINELSDQVALVKEGNMGRMEAMLVTQAHTLDALFSELTGRARMNMGQYMDASYKYMQLAFKAQSQCRCTIEALAEIKNPRPVAFIRQQNVGENVQVNNGQSISRGKENLKPINKLLEIEHEQSWMDARATETSSGLNHDLEALAAQYRPKDGGR